MNTPLLTRPASVTISHLYSLIAIHDNSYEQVSNGKYKQSTVCVMEDLRDEPDNYRVVLLIDILHGGVHIITVYESKERLCRTRYSVVL